MAEGPNAPQRSALLIAAGATALAYLLANSQGVVHAPLGVMVSLLAIATSTLAGLHSLGRGPTQDTLRAMARVGAVLLICAQWASEAREVLGALVVMVVWFEAARGVSAARPLIPLAGGLVWALGWCAVRPVEGIARVAAVAAIAAFGVSPMQRWSRISQG
ncbi:MAG: hypothetical protein Q8Q09_26265 [Deltaproteobacteria bacterium]|nr:hypothetical protein [Deltaproteobacteria bacterium]